MLLLKYVRDQRCGQRGQNEKTGLVPVLFIKAYQLAFFFITGHEMDGYSYYRLEP
jgi:hypothetical protein